MRRTGLAVVVGILSGCLYVGGINHAPDGEIQVATKIDLNQWDVVLTAYVSDKDGDELHYEWEVVVTPTEGKPYTISLRDQSADGSIPIADGGAGSSTLRTVAETLDRVKVSGAKRGSYDVTLRAFDDRGASRQLTTSFKLENQPPTIVLGLDVETDYKSTDNVDVGDSSKPNPAHAHYRIWLKDQPGESEDFDGDLTCANEKASITYTLVKPATDLLDYFDKVPCQTGGLLDDLRFRFDPTKVIKDESVEIRVKVDDGYGGTVEETKTLDVVPNRPACIKGKDGTYPPIPPGSLKVPVIAQDGRRFEVTWPDDDVNEGMTYSWLVRDPGGTFESVQQGVSGAVFQLPAWYRMPGQEVELRVVVTDRVQAGMHPGCSVDTPLCRDTAASLPNDCYQWVTWQVQFL